MRAQPPPQNWKVYLIADVDLCGENLLEIIHSAVLGGASAVQLRAKKCSTRVMVELGRSIKKILSPQISFLINDRVDVALACKADGAHLGQTDLSTKDARDILGPDAWIGFSIETLEQIKSVEYNDADYLGIGPVFETRTKENPALSWGLKQLHTLRQNTGKTLIAIGGIQMSNAADVLQTGVDGIAVASAICNSKNPERSTRELVSLW